VGRTGEGYLDRESAAWAKLDELLDGGRGSFGWPANAVAGHVAFWLDRAARALEAKAAGTFDPADFRIDVDRENERRLPAWTAMPMSDARSALTTARDRIRSAWSAIRTPDEGAAAWFAGDTFEHYDEHVSGATDGA
jgi:hypothetical protein